MNLRRARSSLPRFGAIALSAALFACAEPPGEPPEESVEQPLATAAHAAYRVRQLFFEKHYARAAREGKRMREEHPDDAELTVWIVLGLVRSRGHGEAAQLVEESKSRFADDPWQRFAVAAAMMWNRDYDEETVLAASEAALAANPEHPDFIWLRAELMRLRGQKTEAIAFLESLPDQLEANAELMNVRAGSLFDLSLEDPMDAGKRAAALEAYALSRATFPNNVNAHYQPGWFLLVQQRPEEAYPLLKRAAELSYAPQVLRTYWGSIVQQQSRSDSDKLAEFEQSLARALELDAVELRTLEMAAATYRRLGETEKAHDMAAMLRARDPQSRAAESLTNSLLIGMLGDPQRDETRFREMLRDYLARDTFYEPIFQRQAQRMMLGSIADDPAVDPQELKELLQAMTETAGGASIEARVDGTIALANRGVHLDFAERLAKDGLAALPEYVRKRQAAAPERVELPDVSPKLEAAMRDALGWVYFMQGRRKPALKELEAAYALDQNRPSLLLHLADIHESSGDFAAAEDYLVQCAALPMAENHPCANVLQEFFTRRGIEGSFDDYLGSLHAAIVAARNARIGGDSLPTRERPPAFRLTSLDGETVRLADLEGRFAIIKFWATWCAPCRVEMPFYHDLAKRLEDNDDVRVLSISVDVNPDAVRTWLEDNDFDIEVLMDDQYASSVNVFGVPRTWFLDPDLYKVYELHGMSHDLENEYVDRLNAMRAAHTD